MNPNDAATDSDSSHDNGVVANNYQTNGVADAAVTIPDKPTAAALLAFVRQMAREAPRPLTQRETDLAELVVAIRKKWSSGVAHVKQIASRARRRSGIGTAPVPVLAAMVEGAQPAKKRRIRGSPELDAIEPSAVAYKGPVLESFPQRRKVDSLLHSVATMFHQPNKVGVPPGMEQFLYSDQDRLHYSTLDALLSPLRKQSIWENWSPLQIALFEAGVYTLGKNFHQIAKLIDHKTTGDIVNLYYHWKQSSHYQAWKAMGKPIAASSTFSPEPRPAKAPLTSAAATEGIVGPAPKP